MPSLPSGDFVVSAVFYRDSSALVLCTLHCRVLVYDLGHSSVEEGEGEDDEEVLVEASAALRVSVNAHGGDADASDSGDDHAGSDSSGEDAPGAPAVFPCSAHVVSLFECLLVSWHERGVGVRVDWLCAQTPVTSGVALGVLTVVAGQGQAPRTAFSASMPVM